mgnify:CR=1 FL=1
MKLATLRLSDRTVAVRVDADAAVRPAPGIQPRGVARAPGAKRQLPRRDVCLERRRILIAFEIECLAARQAGAFIWQLVGVLEI